MATRHSFSDSQQHFNGSREQQGQQRGGEGQEGMFGQVQAAGQAVQSQAQHYVEDYPISTVLAVFGIGLGVGVVLGSAMLSSSSSSSSDWMPESSSSSWFPKMSSSSNSSWFPSMSSSGSSWWPSSSSSWNPNSSNSWFSGNHSNWTDGMMRSAKNMCGY